MVRDGNTEELGPDVSSLWGYAVRASRKGFNYTHVCLLPKMLPDWKTENDVSLHLCLTVRNIPYAAQINKGTVVPTWNRAASPGWLQIKISSFQRILGLLTCLINLADTLTSESSWSELSLFLGSTCSYNCQLCRWEVTFVRSNIVSKAVLNGVLIDSWNPEISTWKLRKNIKLCYSIKVSSINYFAVTCLCMHSHSWENNREQLYTKVTTRTLEA